MNRKGPQVQVCHYKVDLGGQKGLDSKEPGATKYSFCFEESKFPCLWDNMSCSLQDQFWILTNKVKYLLSYFLYFVKDLNTTLFICSNSSSNLVESPFGLLEILGLPIQFWNLGDFIVRKSSKEMILSLKLFHLACAKTISLCLCFLWY